MAESLPSLLFIPDITGFTEFVDETEIQHGQHIISELLEIIIDSNQLGMEVSEVEGDAVLFYKYQQVPTAEQLLRQAETIFLNFHNHLKKYDTQRICQCGACTNTSTLSLKIIAHIGEIGFTTVKSVQKPYGTELITVHKLLKNDVNEKEYLLFSEKLTEYFGEASDLNDDWVQLKDGSSTYEKLGKQQYKYIPLSPLYDKVVIPPPPAPPTRTKNPARREIFIDRPMYFVFELVTNLDLRLQWNQGVRELEYQRDRVNRVGTKHRCLFDSGFADFESIKADFGDDKLVYGELLSGVKVAREVSIYYILSEENGGTHVTLELHLKPLPVIGGILKALLVPKFIKGFEGLLHNLKELAEEAEDIPYQAATA